MNIIITNQQDFDDIFDHRPHRETLLGNIRNMGWSELASQKGCVISPNYSSEGSAQFEVLYAYSNHKPVVGLEFIGTAS